MRAEDPQAPGRAENSSLQAELEAIRSEIAEIRKSVDGLREALQQRGPLSESSPVTIRVESPDGQPLSGFDVEMTTPPNMRRIKATGTSGDDGLGLSRDMPYGEYWLHVKHPSGWYAGFGSVTVEVGKPFEKTVVAPDPDERATLTVSSSLDEQAFAGLLFGEKRDYRGGGAYAKAMVPEPDEDTSEFPRFPTLESGILEAAAQVSVTIERKLEQPDGKTQTWYWRPDRDRFPAAILAGTGRVIPIVEYDDSIYNPDDSARYFRAEEPPENDFAEEEDEFTVGYLTMRPRPESEREAQWQIVPGHATVAVKRFVGRAAPDLVETLDAEMEADQQVWLEAPSYGSSNWIPRILDLEGWERGDSIQFHARKVLDVRPGEEVDIEVRSP